jgi:hypothetical protein
LPVGAGTIALRFLTKSDAEDGGWDIRAVEVFHPGLPYPTELARLASSDWYEQHFDLTPFAGHDVRLRVDFNTGDPVENQMRGWYIDDVHVELLAQPGIVFCAGDGHSIDCPCGNFGAAGHGCATSFSPAGSELGATGVARVSADTFVLSANGLSPSVVTFFQGTQQAAGGRGLLFGDGLRCAAGSVVRLKSVLASGGAAQFPAPGDPSVSVAGLMPAGGGFRTYQVWYRNAADFCTTSTFNLSNGLMVTWTP